VQGLQLPRGVWGGMAFSSPSCLGVHRALGRWTKQPWVPKWPRVLPGLITGCRVTCKSSCSIRNANGLLPFPCSTSPDPDAKEVGKLPSSWPFPEPPDRPRCCLLRLCSPCPSRTEQPGSAAAKGASWGGSAGAQTLQPLRELLGEGLWGLGPCSRRESPSGRVCGGSDPAATKGAPWGGSAGTRTLQPLRETLRKGLRGLRPCSR